MKGGLPHVSIPGREKQGLYRNEQPPPTQPGLDPKGQKAIVVNAVLAGGLGLYTFLPLPYQPGKYRRYTHGGMGA